MSTLSSIFLAIDLANVRRDQAMAHWQKAMQEHAFSVDQMKQLKQYAQETEQRWGHSAQQSTTPELLQHHYQFMERLYQTMDLQDGVLHTSQKKVDTARQFVIQAEFRLASLKKVVEKKQADLDKLQRSRDQKQMDEFAALQTQRQKRLIAENNL
jgi:flagellar FliJ protein